MKHTKKNTMAMRIFLIFFKLGFYAFGGGYSIIPILETEVVDKENIVSKEKFVDIVSIAQGLPGAIALNASIFIGYISSGIAGAITAAIGSILPSVIIVTSIMMVFSGVADNEIVKQSLHGIRPVVVALILYAAFKIAKKSYKNKWYFILTLVGFIVPITFSSFPLPLLIIAGLIVGILLNIIELKIRRNKDVI